MKEGEGARTDRQSIGRGLPIVLRVVASMYSLEYRL